MSTTDPNTAHPPPPPPPRIAGADKYRGWEDSWLGGEGVLLGLFGVAALGLV
ncbi:MAG: hypothetical protein KTU85_08285 [Acidimicrobiia bacterium]|nr:hypothetical protein [Acidimicrobiia bacterium]